MQLMRWCFYLKTSILVDHSIRCYLDTVHYLSSFIFILVHVNIVLFKRPHLLTALVCIYFTVYDFFLFCF